MKTYQIKRVLIALLICVLLPLQIAGADDELPEFFDDGMVETEPSFDNFVKTRTYRSGQFSDVAVSSWYAPNVAVAYELGLMQGSGDGSFGVNGNATIAETIALAARLSSIFHFGDAQFEQGDVWYRCYVDYALDTGIIRSEYPNYSAAATRAQFAEIMANALPTYALSPINWVDDDVIPDVSLSDSFGEAVYLLYRAGILTGSDEFGTFRPSSNILRTEVATLVARMTDESLRQSLTLVGEY